MAVLARLVQGDEPNWSKLVLFALFFAVPLLGRLLKKVSKSGGDPDSADAPVGDLSAQDERRLAREEERRAQVEGEDLWRRLANGEESAAEPPARPKPAVVVLTGEAQAEPTPLAVLGEVSEPTEVSEVSLEQPGDAALLAPMVATKDLEVSVEPTRPRFLLTKGDLGRGVLLSEILAPPLSLRGGG